MRRLTTLLLLAGVTFTAQAQIVDDYQPDSDGDGCVGMSDLLSLLSVFGSCETQAFACGDPINYQGYDYATVQIGEQCWFAENLRSELYLNGDSIPANLSNSEWANTSSGAVAVHGESGGCTNFSPNIDACDPTQSLSEYGRLYNWYAVGDARGLCPSGWHVPTDGEWTVMTDLFGGVWAGSQMKTNYGWFLDSTGTNSSGFSGLPGGHREVSGLIYGAGYLGVWWSSSPYDFGAWSRILQAGPASVERNPYFPADGLSVRCIQD